MDVMKSPVVVSGGGGGGFKEEMKFESNIGVDEVRELGMIGGEKTARDGDRSMPSSPNRKDSNNSEQSGNWRGSRRKRAIEDDPCSNGEGLPVTQDAILRHRPTRAIKNSNETIDNDNMIDKTELQVSLSLGTTSSGPKKEEKMNISNKISDEGKLREGLTLGYIASSRD
ncbi:hypothetical protein QJS10_CPA10g00613 [Acorus calamus]|uniref:Uncharacterized protein n=1 Tax=Acorus calamus TaxID=4465 RepID=A0AAV9E1G7_ACOCL|nr:hypothetical protein QJS10_CPA10g00613 [Acorus calamus]